MSEEVILQFMAQDDISPVVSMIQNNVVASMSAIQSTMSNMDSAFNNTSVAVNHINDANQVFIDTNKGVASSNKDVESSVKSNTGAVKQNASATRDSSSATKEATQSTNNSADAWNNHTNIANMSAGSLMYLSGQLSSLGTRAEESAQSLNDLKISMDQVAKMSGVGESEMADMITYMSNETFPNDEAVLYTKNLTQMGVASEHFVEQATNMDKINDAFGLGAQTTNSLVTELSVLGVDMTDISSSFNALAYANENTKGGMENFYSFLRKYDAQLNELGYDVDQTAIIIAAATAKYGGGRAALTGLSDALKEAGNDTSALESALNLKAGALEHASEETSTYEGQLQSLAEEELQHKTILQRIGAAVDDFKLKHAEAFTTAESLMGAFGHIGSMALYANSIREMAVAFAAWKANPGAIMNTVSRLREYFKLQKEVQALSSASTASSAMATAGQVPLPDVKKTAPSGVGKNMGKTAKETQQVVKGATATGALGAEASAAGAGMKATSTGLRSIGSGALSMVAPLLQISVAIMILLPVLALIAAEALVLLKGLQLLVKALGFDKVDLTKSIEGIKQVGRALFELGVAMAELTFATLITALSGITTGLLQIVNPIGIAGQQLINVANQLKIFNTVQIDKSVPEKIKSISEALGLISNAMKGLVGLQLGVVWDNVLSFFLRTNIADAMAQVRKELLNAGNEIAKIKDVPDLDEGAVGKLQKIGSALDSIGKAMDGLRSIRDSQNFDVSGWIGGLFGGANIGQALESIKQDVYDASEALKEFDGVETIPEDVGTNLKRVADSLKSVGDSIKTLRTIRDDYNWDTGWLGGWFQDSNISQSVDGIKTTLVEVSASLKSLGDEGGLEDVGEDLSEKIKKVTDTLSSVLSAVDKMGEFKGKGGGENEDDFSGVVTTIENAKSSLASVSKSLSSLNKGGEEGGLEDVGDIKSKIDNISNSIKALNSGVTQLQAFPKVSRSIIGINVSYAVQTVQNVAKYLNGLKDVESISGNVETVITSVTKSGSALKDGISKFNDFPKVDGQNIGYKTGRAVTGVKRAGAQLKTLEGISPVSGAIGTLISSVTTSSNKLKTSANALNKFPKVNGQNIGYKIGRAVTGVKRAVTQLNSLSGSSLKGGINSVLSSVSSAIAQLKTTISKMSGGFKVDGSNIGSNLKSGIGTGLHGLGDTVSGAVHSAAGSASSAASSAGSSLASSMVTGFSNTFKIATVISGEMSAGLTAITSATPDLSNAMGALAQQMVDSFKSNAEIASPGAVARSIRDEMNYGNEFVINNGRNIVSSVGRLARNMVTNFNPNLQSSLDTITTNLRTNTLSRRRFETLQGIGDASPRGGNNQRPVTIMINEGAIQLDARNLTTQESRQIIVSGLEGLDVIEGINIKGV